MKTNHIELYEQETAGRSKEKISPLYLFEIAYEPLHSTWEMSIDQRVQQRELREWTR